VKVFDHLAESIYLFLKEENMLNERLPLGLYPLQRICNADRFNFI